MSYGPRTTTCCSKRGAAFNWNSWVGII